MSEKTKQKLYGQTSKDEELILALEKYTSDEDIERLGKIIGSKISKTKNFNFTLTNMVSSVMRGISSRDLSSRDKIRAMSSISNQSDINFEEARGIESLFYVKGKYAFVNSFFKSLTEVSELLGLFVREYSKLEEVDRKKMSDVMDGFIFSEEYLKKTKNSLSTIFGKTKQKPQSKKPKKQETEIVKNEENTNIKPKKTRATKAKKEEAIEDVEVKTEMNEEVVAS